MSVRDRLRGDLGTWMERAREVVEALIGLLGVSLRRAGGALEFGVEVVAIVCVYSSN